jgi:hypothetical protein
MKASYRLLLSSFLCLSVATAAPSAQAELLGRDSNALQRAQAHAVLVAQGVEATEAQARVAALTDDEAVLLASKFDELPAAGGGGDALVVLVAFAAVVYVVIQLLPFILIGGGAVAAIRASNSNG